MMSTLHVIKYKSGWVLKWRLDDMPSVLIERKIEALSMARRLAARESECVILLYEDPAEKPEVIKFNEYRKTWRARNWGTVAPVTR
jgi:hypothetical protein